MVSVYAVIQAIIQFKEVIISVIVISIVILMGVLVYYLLRVGHPVSAWLGHSIDLENYMKTVWIPEFKRQTTALFEDPNTSPELRNKVQKEKLDTLSDDDIVFFFMFYDFHTLKARDLQAQRDRQKGFNVELEQKWWYTESDVYLIPKIAPTSIRNKANLEWFKSGIFDAQTFEKYLNEKMLLIRDLANAVRLHVQGSQTKTLQAQDMHIFRLHLLLNEYRTDLVYMYNTRKTHGMTMQFNIFRLYLSEFNENIIKKRILKETWSDFSSQVEGFRYSLMNEYETNMRAALLKKAWSLPVDMFNKDISKEGFTTDKTMNNEEIVREDFNPKKLFKAIGGIGTFFKNIFKIIPKLFKIVISTVALITQPQKLVFKLLALFIGLVLFIVIIVLDALRTLIVLILSYVFALAYCVLYTLLWLLIYGIVLIIFFILWVLDLCTGGQVLKLLRCENKPDAWIHQPNFAFKNIFSRSFFCVKPCGNRFCNKTGSLFCKRLESYEPQFCPQQIIHSAYEKRGIANASVETPHLFTFKPGADFWTKTSKDKKRAIKTFYQDRKVFLQTCHKEYANKEPFTKLVCEKIDAFIDPKSQPDLFNKTVDACQQIYCDYRVLTKGQKYEVVKRMDKEREAFCRGSVIEAEEEEIQNDDILTRIVSLLMWTFFICICIISVFFVIAKQI